MRVEPFRDLVVPRPKITPSGLFPVVGAVPQPPDGLTLRLRRAVALTVVVGTVGLLAYVSWQRVGPAAPVSAHPQPSAR